MPQCVLPAIPWGPIRRVPRRPPQLEAPNVGRATGDGFSLDLANMRTTAVDHLRQTDARLKPWVDQIGPIKLPPRRNRDPYPALLESIVYQQLHATAALAIWTRVLALFADRNPLPDRIMRITDEQLRAAGLSRSKAVAMRSVAEAAMDGGIPDERRIARMPDSEIYEQLTRIRGIGPWTVDMLLIFTLRRPDVMPLNDYGIRKAFKLVYRKKSLPTTRQLLEISQRWRPYRTTAALYFWRIADTPNGA